MELRKGQEVYHNGVMVLKKEQLKSRVEELEDKLEKMDREQRKMNIIIKGPEPGSETDSNFVQNFLPEKIGVTIEVQNVQKF